nr:RecName: Full=Insulinotropic peptide 2 [Agalychnis spurrelli]
MLADVFEKIMGD